MPLPGEGRYSSEIQHLLRDYGRAREEARGKLSRARLRLRQRTELERRRPRLQGEAAGTEVRLTAAGVSLAGVDCSVGAGVLISGVLIGMPGRLPSPNCVP